MRAFFSDPKNLAPIVGALAAVLIQVARRCGVDLDPTTASALSLAFVTTGVGIALSHAHVEHAETIADGHVEAAKIGTSQVESGKN